VLDVDEYSKYLIDFKHEPDPDKLNKKITHINKEIQTKSSDNIDMTEATSIFSQHIDIYLR